MSKKSDEFIGILAIFGIVIFFIFKILSAIFTLIADNIYVIITVILSVLGAFIAFLLYFELYFRSKKFKHIKGSIREYTDNCNELNHYIQELKGSYVNIESYNYGIGELTDNSAYNFQRKEWSKVIQSNQIHHCSANVCKNASNQPIKYLCKYFGIKNDEESLSKFEKVLNDFTSVEQGKDLLKRERNSIMRRISKSIPFLIKKFRNEQLIRKLGFETVDISETYIPTFTFQYVSAGGNSSSRCDIKLNIENLNLLINYLNDIIKWTKSIAGQRALMTSQLRDKIKGRDNYKCCSCGLGIEDEPNLLLEIDHKIPLSKGGMTTYDNLQTLCWKCNRTKAAKIL
ncbi:HNH endonuclease [Sunxiuqinia sp. A32]|uniref:HNH endonuclease n=1 Tax=Sunxiuqinia sp. A32 TaxID=3461496 RepID=UPI0040466CF3